jgi:hypothetical protein
LVLSPYIHLESLELTFEVNLLVGILLTRKWGVIGIEIFVLLVFQRIEVIDGGSKFERG